MAAQDNTERLMVVAAVADERSREWVIDERDYPSEDDFRAAAAEELARFEHLGFRMGRALMAAPIRMASNDGSYRTVGWSFREVFVPAARVAEAEQPTVENEPAAAA